MDKQDEEKGMLSPYVSVDCVLLSIKNDKLTVLLTEIEMGEEADKSIGCRLPGSFIYEFEDLKDAAYRVLRESVGLDQVSLRQFRCFGSPSRMAHKQDVEWLRRMSGLAIGRLITVPYLAFCGSDRRVGSADISNRLAWYSLDRLPKLLFDQREIIEVAVEELRYWAEKEPSIVFDYLPLKFTVFQMRRTYELIYGRSLDVRNFQKKMNSLGYIQPTDDWQDGVAHRAARYYRFDRMRYEQQRSKYNKI